MAHETHTAISVARFNEETIMAERRYININGEYGLTHAGKNGWASAQEVLAEMDRLGIWQTVLEFTGAANALYRAKTLLKDIASLPNGKERIIPCFSVEPVLLFQTGGIEEMIEIMKNNRPFCVNVRPMTSSFSLQVIEEVLEKISFLDPVIMLSISQVRDRNKGADDLVYLARRFPNMHFVIRQFHHTGWPFAFNALRRAENILMDISRVHTTHAVEVACEHFGEHRVLFGQSLRGSGGASMGAIEYAEVPEETKEKIRCGNFISLFSDPKDREYLTANLKAVDDHVQNSFWKPFINGQGVTKADLYDVHTHLGYTASYGYVRNLTFESQIAQFEKEMARFNTKKIVSTVTGIPDPIACHLEKEAAVQGRTDRFKGYVRYNPNYEEVFTDAFMKERFDTGYYVGLKTLPAYMQVDIADKRYARMFQYANEHGLPVLIHTESNKATPMKCARVAEQYPNAKVILGHSGMNDQGRAECEKIAQDPRYNNVYFEFCATFLSTRTWAESLEFIDYKRVLYGTDAPIHSVVWELGRLLSEDIPDEKMEAILGGNAKRLFGF